MLKYAQDCVSVLGLFEFLMDFNNLDVQDENQGSSTVFRTWTTFTDMYTATLDFMV